MRPSLSSAFCLLALVVSLAVPARLRAQIVPDQIRITKIFGYQQTAPDALAEGRSAVDVAVTYRSTVPTTWSLTFSTGAGVFFPLVRDPKSSPFDISFLGSRSFDSITELNLGLPANTYGVHIVLGDFGAANVSFAAAFDPALPTTLFNDYDALQSWDGEARTLSWQPISGATPDETRVFTLERADGTVLFDTRVDDVPLYNGSTFVEIPKVASKAGDVLYATLTYTRLRSSNVINSGGVVSLYQTFRVRVPLKRPPPPAPVITTAPASLATQLGASVSFTVAATGADLSYVWKKDGATLTGATTATLSLASVQAAQAGSYTVTVTNPGGSVTSPAASLSFTPVTVAPVITALSPNQTATVGSTVTLNVTPGGTAPFTYQWLRNGTALAGATTAGLTFAPVALSDAGDYSVRITNSAGTATSVVSTLTVRAVAPAISTAPASVTVFAGAKVVLSVTATGTAPLAYQWFRDGTAVPGATAATLTLDPALVSDSAGYRVTVVNAAGASTSSTAAVSVTPISRISNLSVLTSLSTAGDSFTLGYVVGGASTSGSKPVLLRAVGPALGALGVGGTLDDPKLETFAGAAKTGENDNWGGTAPLITAFTSVGAFPFAAATSRDAALTASLTSRDNSVKISAAASGTGLVLAEIYDATASDTFTSATPRLLNVSVLKSLGTGLTVGFTLAGSTAKAVLIRAIGPTLGDFGVPGTVADPQLKLFNSSSAQIGENDNWSGTAALTAAFASVGAFALPATSKDAALLATLSPGGYSVQVTGVNTTTGAALVEVYEVP